jgi:hypothetical protein
MKCYTLVVGRVFSETKLSEGIHVKEFPRWCRKMFGGRWQSEVGEDGRVYSTKAFTTLAQQSEDVLVFWKRSSSISLGMFVYSPRPHSRLEMHRISRRMICVRPGGHIRFRRFSWRSFSKAEYALFHDGFRAKLIAGTESDYLMMSRLFTR